MQSYKHIFWVFLFNCWTSFPIVIMTELMAHHLSCSWRLKCRQKYKVTNNCIVSCLIGTSTVLHWRWSCDFSCLIVVKLCCLMLLSSNRKPRQFGTLCACVWTDHLLPWTYFLCPEDCTLYVNATKTACWLMHTSGVIFTDVCNG